METPRNNSDQVKPRRPPAKSAAGRERQLGVLAYDLAEKQMLEGTASAQVITYFLKANSDRERLERENLQMEKELRQSKIDQSSTAGETKELYAKALKAFRGYRGEEDDSNVEDEFYG